MTGADAQSTTTASQETDESPRRSTSATAHAAAWVFVFLILRVFAVSGYDWDTAFLVSTTLGLDDGLSLLFGSLMAGRLLTAVLLVGVLPLLIGAYLWGPRAHRPVVMLLATLGLITLVALTVSFGSWWLPLATAAVLGMFALIRRQPPQRRMWTAAMTRVGSVSAVAVLLVAALVQTPWVPRERIETTDGTVTGYVLSVDSDT